MNEGVQILFASNRAAALAVQKAFTVKGIPASLNAGKIDPKRAGLLVWTDAQYSETKSKAVAFLNSNPRYPLVHVNVGSKALPDEFADQVQFAFADTAELENQNSDTLSSMAKYFSFQNNLLQRWLRLWARWQKHPVKVAIAIFFSILMFSITQLGLKAINVCTYYPETCGRWGMAGYPSVVEQRAWSSIPYLASKAQIDEFLQKFGKGYYAGQAQTALNDKVEDVSYVWEPAKIPVQIGSAAAFEALGGVDSSNLNRRLWRDAAATCSAWEKNSVARGQPFRLQSSSVEPGEAGLATAICKGETRVEKVRSFYRITRVRTQ